MSSESSVDSDHISRNVLASPACSEAFGRMFWAFPFYIDFNITVGRVSVDLLPDLVGWILVITALGKILELSARVADLQEIGFWMLFFSIFSFIEIDIRWFEDWLISPADLLSFVGTILRLLFIWWLGGLIMNMARVAGDDSIYAKADFRRTLNVVLAFSTVFMMLLVQLVPATAILLLIGLLPFSVIVFALLMGLMSGAKEMCRRFAASAIDGQ